MGSVTKFMSEDHSRPHSPIPADQHVGVRLASSGVAVTGLALVVGPIYPPVPECRPDDVRVLVAQDRQPAHDGQDYLVEPVVETHGNLLL